MPAGRRSAAAVERRARQHDLSRSQLLDAAEGVFGAKGVVASTMKEIAELAGYSVGAVYLFFESKDDLLAAVLARRGIEMTDGIERIVRSPGPALDRLVALARFEVEFFSERPAFARLYLRTAAIGPLLPESVAGEKSDVLLQRAVTLTAQLLHDGQQAGEICAGPPEVLSRILSGIVTSYQTFAVGDGDPRLLDDFDTEHLGDLVRRTFGATPPARKRKGAS
jgi:TetR/AcrR family transcriptional regulator